MMKNNPHALWQYATGIYANPDVKRVCLDWQDRYDFNVNIILYICWFAGQTYGHLSAEQLTHLTSQLAVWNDALVKNLRALRQALKPFPDLQNAAFREEMAAEYCEQSQLMHVYPGICHEQKTPEQIREDAERSLKQYFESHQQTPSDEDLGGIGQLLQVALSPSSGDQEHL
jgi:uncharacterized protein (TIGR02444 family)